MSDLAGWKLHGPVRTLRQEYAEWDPSQGAWQVARNVSTVTFRRDGQVSEREFHNSDGSVAGRTRRVDIDDDGTVHTTEEETDVQQCCRYEHQYDSHGNWIERVILQRFGSQPDFQRSNVQRRRSLTPSSDGRVVPKRVDCGIPGVKPKSVVR
jgi:hypothetical protein